MDSLFVRLNTDQGPEGNAAALRELFAHAQLPSTGGPGILPHNPEVSQTYRDWRQDQSDAYGRIGYRDMAEDIVEEYDSGLDDDEDVEWAQDWVASMPREDLEENQFWKAHGKLGAPTYHRSVLPPKEPPTGMLHGGRVRSGPGAPPQGRSLT
jgi:hypothetical protein